MKKIAVAGFQHETNTFAKKKADFKAFEMTKDWPGLSVGDDLQMAVAGFNLPIAGAIESLQEQQFELAPLCWAFAVPCGFVTRDAYERISKIMLQELAKHEDLDGIYLDLHGAMVSEHFEDAEGELLRRIRMQVGSEIPIVASLDYHANITEQMMEYADYLDVFRNYPHTDMSETGRRAAAVLGDMVLCGSRFLKKMVKSDFLIPLTLGCTTEEPCQRLLVTELAALRGDLSKGSHISFAAGFALADIEEAGPAIIAYGHQSSELEQAVQSFKQLLDQSETVFQEPGIVAVEAVQLAMMVSEKSTKPVVLADAQDNPGAGGTGDTTGLLRALFDCGAKNSVIGFIADANAVAAAVAEGVGALINLEIGGQEFEGDYPFKGDFTVLAIENGEVVGTGPMWRGAQMQLGPCVLLESKGIKVALSSKTVQTGDQSMFRHLGVDLATQSIVAVKSSVHFRADFQPIAAKIIIALAPGPVVADPMTLVYQKLRADVRIGPGLGTRLQAS